MLYTYLDLIVGRFQWQVTLRQTVPEESVQKFNFVVYQKCFSKMVQTHPDWQDKTESLLNKEPHKLICQYCQDLFSSLSRLCGGPDEARKYRELIFAK